MAKTKEQKEKITKGLKVDLSGKKNIIFLDFKSLDTHKLFDLRNKLKESDCRLLVVKKSLLQRILEKTGEEEFLAKIKEIRSQLALVFSLGDGIASAKICYQLSKENKNLKILGGAERNEGINTKYNILGTEEIISLAQLPSKTELLFKLVYTLKSPLSGLVDIFRNNIKGLINVLANAKI